MFLSESTFCVKDLIFPRFLLLPYLTPIKRDFSVQPVRLFRLPAEPHETAKVAITETQRRREIQNKYNVEHGIVPKTIVKKVSDILEISTHDDSEFKNTKKLSKAQKQQLTEKLTKEMKAAAKLLEFEHAAYLRDKIKKLRGEK